MKKIFILFFVGLIEANKLSSQGNIIYFLNDIITRSQYNSLTLYYCEKHQEKGNFHG